MITEEDKEFLQLKGVDETILLEQLNMFRSGFPYLQLSAAASVQEGILTMDDPDRRKTYLNAWEKYKATLLLVR